MTDVRPTRDGGEEPGLLRRIAAAALELPIRRPWPLILVSLALALAGAYVYFFQLEIVSTRGALTDPTAAFNQRWRAYQRAFGGERDFLVLILSAPREEGDSIPPAPDAAQRAAMKGVADRWAEALRRRPDFFPDVDHRLEPSALGDHVLLYLPHATVEAAAEELGSLLPRLEATAGDPRPAIALAQLRELLSEIEAPDASEDGDAAREGLRAVLEALEDGFSWFGTRLRGDADPALLPEAGELLGAVGSGDLDPEGYFFVGEGRLLTVLADTREEGSRRNRYEAAVTYARTALDSALASVPDSVRLEAGLTGEPALEYEEMVTSQRDFARSTVLAFVLISLLFMWAFRSVLRPGLAALCLGIGIAITFGVTWLAIGHLNVLAMVFAVILVALGIDFAIHFYTHYRRALARGRGPTGAVRETYSAIGGALWVAGIATAAAFLSAYLTDFPGLSELGLIAGSGLLISLSLVFFVFPAMLLMVDARWPSPPLPERRPFRLLRGLVRRTGSRAARVGLGAVALLAVLGFVLGQYRVNTNLLELQPAGGEAARWQRLLLRTEDRTTYALTTYPERASLERAREAFGRSPVVGSTETAFPGREEEKRALLRPLCRRIRDVRVSEPGPVSVRETRRELFGLRQTLRRFSRSGPGAAEALAGLEGEVTGAYRILGELPEATAEARLGEIATELRGGLEDGVERGRDLLCPPPLTVASLPGVLRERYVGSDGTLAMRIYPAGDTWSTEDLEWFVEGARQVDPAIFGGVVNVYENAEAMVRSFIQAAGYSSLALLLLVSLWSRSVRATALALLPLAAGMGLLLGVMRWNPVPIRWNLANLFAVPIIIGIGIDGGIHLVRAWRLEGEETFRGSLEAVLMSALTTMIGFGLLATGDHAGVSSLGLIVFLGVALNLVVCMTALPVALAWLDPRAGDGGAP